jgi:hypothetical protein
MIGMCDIGQPLTSRKPNNYSSLRLGGEDGYGEGAGLGT